MEGFFIASNVIVLIIYLPLSYLFKIGYPKEVNSIMGYRTKRSMSSQEAWLLANSYSSRLMFDYSLVTAAVQIILLFFFSAETALLVTCGVFITTLFLIIVQTEIKLKKN